MEDGGGAKQAFHITQLYASSAKRERSKTRLYDGILQKALLRVKNIANHRGDYHCVYAIPEFIFGEPHYDPIECSGYVVCRLRSCGFDSVEYYHPNQIVISWYSEFMRQKTNHRDNMLAAAHAPPPPHAHASPPPLPLTPPPPPPLPRPPTQQQKRAPLKYVPTGDLFR